MEKSKLENIKKNTAIVLPSLFTLGNMAFGFFSILQSANKEYLIASYFLIGSYIMDVLDGRVARLVKGESKFGIEFDSFSDFMSFGIAPAYLIYNFILKEYGFWGYPVAFLYVLCGAIRLVRFNIKALLHESSKQYFEGLPIPGAAGIVISFVLSYSLIERDNSFRSISLISSSMPFIYGLFPFVMIALSLLMVSTIPYAAFKKNSFFKFTSLTGLIIGVSIISIIIAYPQNALFVFFSTYAISGIIFFIYKAFFPEKEQE